jgi:hypothetical protein
VTLHAELPEEAAPEMPEGPVVEEPVEEEPVEEPASLVPAPVTVEWTAEEAVADAPVEAPRRRGFWGWLFRTRTGGPEIETAREIEPDSEPEGIVGESVAQEPAAEERIVEEPVAEEPVVEEPESVEAAGDAVDPERARAILDEALDALGAAHHRPFSRG